MFMGTLCHIESKHAKTGQLVLTLKSTSDCRKVCIGQDIHGNQIKIKERYILMYLYTVSIIYDGMAAFYVDCFKFSCDNVLLVEFIPHNHIYVTSNLHFWQQQNPYNYT